MDNRTFLIKNFELQIKKYINFSTSVSEKSENVFFPRIQSECGKMQEKLRTRITPNTSTFLRSVLTVHP